MAILDREKHEELLNELLNAELEVSRKTEILQELRISQSTALQSIGDYEGTTKKLQDDNSDLVVSNSKLFRQLGVVGKEEEEKVEEKDFSESITLESIEGGN